MFDQTAWALQIFDETVTRRVPDDPSIGRISYGHFIERSKGDNEMQYAGVPSTISHTSAIFKYASFALALQALCCALAFGQSDDFQPNSSAGPTGVLVHSKFGGQIFGFDIDQNGTEGLLAEAKTLSNGNVLAAVETFDQATGAILRGQFLFGKTVQAILQRLQSKFAVLQLAPRSRHSDGSS